MDFTLGIAGNVLIVTDALPQAGAVTQFWWHLHDVIVLQIQSGQLVQQLQPHRIDGSNLIVAY